jgi:N-acetylglucosamine kinase-like BadF-type ATPase
MINIMGIDGGGSNIRVVIITTELDICTEYLGPAVNPGTVGRDEAAQRIQAAMRETIQQAGLMPEQVAGVGIGIAGASNRYDWAVEWLRGIVQGVTPQAHIVPSSDYEIALVGAHGQRIGILLLAGTGSLAYGVNAAGQSALIGGWGYLLGDEGSGYWLGSQALRAAVRVADSRGRPTLLFKAVMTALHLNQPLDLIPWLYTGSPRVGEVARLAPLVLDCAAQGDPLAREIVETGARELALAVRAVRHRLDMHGHQPMFAGSLLTTPNPLSELVLVLLGMEAIPTPRHTPAVGAALLAREYCK